MTLEELVPKYKTCNKLKDSGWNAETYAIWHDRGFGRLLVRPRIHPVDIGEVYAPTAEETVNVLPETITGQLWEDEVEYELSFMKHTIGPGWISNYVFIDANGDKVYLCEDGAFTEGVLSKSLAESVALLLIWVIENGHYKINPS